MTKILVSLLGLFITTTTFASSSFLQDVASMCANYSSSTHSPCNPSNGFEIMADYIQQQCETTKAQCAQDLNRICQTHSQTLQSSCSTALTMDDQMISLSAMAKKSEEVELLNVHLCSLDALKRANALFKLHNEIESEILDDGRPAYLIDRHVELKAPLYTPNKKKKLAVLEIKGGIYKSSFRMRFIYGPTNSSNNCALIGQEILEESNL